MSHQLAGELTSNGTIKQFTHNSTLIGQYAEATVRRLIQRIVFPLRVSRGGIIHEEICPDNVREADTIIWSPCPIPAIYEAGDFALVPRRSAMGYLEIKSTNYTGVGEKIKASLEIEPNLIQPWLIPQGKDDGGCALGIVCWRENNRKDAVLDELIEQRKAVVLLEQDLSSNPEGIFRLIQFLAWIRLRAKGVDGTLDSGWPTQ